jgi:hypothetical protein
MKKLFFAATLMVAVALIGTSCTKTATTPAEAGMGELTLNMQLNTDESNDVVSNGQAIPNGKKAYENNFPSGYMVQFIVDSKDLQENPVAGYTYDKLIYTGTVSSDGKVTMSLPASRIPHNVEVHYPDMELTRTWELQPSFGLAKRDTTETRIYERATETFSIWEGSMLIKDDILYSVQ